MEKYDFKYLEKKWRNRWADSPIQKDTESKPKYYCLDMFPYPSGTGLHVGHWRGYVMSDVLSRYKILQGYHVLHPMGWDAFGLPAENYAIETKQHPRTATAQNIENFKKQFAQMSAIYDWKDELDTTDPNYYKWTQWIFARMFEAGLAYEKEMPLNWCAKCKVVLANEETVGGCERCGGETTKKNLRQWMLRITKYADRLLNDLDGLNWPEKVKKMQADWIGKSHGAEIIFEVDNGEKIVAYTTRPDTLFGATFLTIAPEHEIVETLATAEQADEVKEYVKRASSRSNVDRMQDKEKTGVFTGRYAVNPISGEKIPVWVADYVLIDYGTGAIMCVPGHDERDFEFATKYGLIIREVISPENNPKDVLTEAYTGDGFLVNSGEYSGQSVADGKVNITKALAKENKGKETTNYRLRDWVFSRQRYWGEPIPIIHCPSCGPVIVPDKDLPVVLPDIVSYEPTDTGESPLANISEWVNTSCPKCNKPAKRETNTMPQWAGSSWYFLRYPDVDNLNELASKKALDDWLPVDYYIGGIEHAVLHLLYARFYTKFLYDIGLVSFEEPFTILFNIGMVNKDGKKMSKSKDHGVSPDEVTAKYGCDNLRMYELFIGPPEIDAEWIDNGLEGVYRFLAKVWRLAHAHNIKETPKLVKLRHKLIYDITNRLNNLSLNTVISGFMEHTNSLNALEKSEGGIDKTTIETLAVLLSPFAPHIAEEIWEMAGNKSSVFSAKWPEYNESLLKEDAIEIALQINGKLRGNISIDADMGEEDVLGAAREFLKDKLEGVVVKKSIYVKGRIVNFVV